jgi:hypothetical protein
MDIWTTGPVCIRVSCQRGGRGGVDVKTVSKSAFKIAEYAFDMIVMR